MIDLDAARAARREALGIHPSVKIDGKTYDLPLELSIETVDLLESFGSNGNDYENVKALLPRLFGDQAEELRGSLSIADAFEVFGGLLGEYGIKPGEARASAKSSASTGGKRRRPSKPSTDSTSEDAPTDPTPSESDGSGA
jgi:hypothetical protein